MCAVKSQLRVTLTLVSTHISLFRTDGVSTSQQCVCIYTAVYSQTLTAISIFKYVNVVCIIQVHTPPYQGPPLYRLHTANGGVLAPHTSHKLADECLFELAQRYFAEASDLSSARLDLDPDFFRSTLSRWRRVGERRGRHSSGTPRIQNVLRQAGPGVSSGGPPTALLVRTMWRKRPGLHRSN